MYTASFLVRSLHLMLPRWGFTNQIQPLDSSLAHWGEYATGVAINPASMMSTGTFGIFILCIMYCAACCCCKDICGPKQPQGTARGALSADTCASCATCHFASWCRCDPGSCPVADIRRRRMQCGRIIFYVLGGIAVVLSAVSIAMATFIFPGLRCQVLLPAHEIRSHPALTSSFESRIACDVVLSIT